MARSITIEYKDPHHKLMKGIYKISFGNKFYIGQCMRLAERMYVHQNIVNSCLRRYAMPKKTEAHYIPIARYLYENPSIEILSVEIVQRCITAWDLGYAERNWLSDFRNNPDCINGTFAGSFYPNHDIWDIEIDKNGIPHYFDPFDPAKKKYHIWTPLNKSGSITVQKPLSKELMAELMYISAGETGTNDKT